MVQDNNLYENMYRFFDRVPDYYISENEYLELAWAPRGEHQVWHRQRVASLKQAAQRGIALGPDYDIAIMVNERLGSAGRDGDYPQLLILWHNRARRPDDHYPRFGLDVSCLVTLRGGHLTASIQHFPDGDRTREAVRFIHRSRPYKPVRYRITRALPPAPEDHRGPQR